MNSYHGQLGVYHLMIVSKYFETIQDFINLELSTPKAKGNMEKFHYNPIALDRWSRQFFTSLETLHLYSEYNCNFSMESFYKRVIHFEIDYDIWEKIKKENEEYKHVVLNYKTLERLRKIPEEVNVIGRRCYHNDRIIKEIIVPNTITSIENSAFSHLPNVTRIELSTNLKKISAWSFCDLRSLKEIVIPDSVTSIGYGVLSSCDKLTALTMPTHWKQIGYRLYNNRPFLSSFRIPYHLKTLNGQEVGTPEHVKEFEIPSYVTKLQNECLRDCAYTKITIPTTIKELPYQCFFGCGLLEEITIPTSVTKLGEQCFYHCRSLETLIIPTSVMELNGNCFSEMTSLKEIEIPSSLTKFSCYQLFYNCSSLTSVTLPNNYKEIKHEQFYLCKSLSRIQLPSSVTRICNCAFANCSSLTSINLENVKVFDDGCFLSSGIRKWNYPRLPSNCF